MAQIQGYSSPDFVQSMEECEQNEGAKQHNNDRKDILIKCHFLYTSLFLFFLKIIDNINEFRSYTFSILLSI